MMILSISSDESCRNAFTFPEAINKIVLFVYFTLQSIKALCLSTAQNLKDFEFRNRPP